MKKQQIVLFGASIGGIRAFNSLKDDYEIVRFVDNNAKLHGTKVKGVIVKPVESLNEDRFDKIFISSQYFDEIMYQLQNELNIDKGLIARVPTEILEGDEEVPWGCLAILVSIVAMLVWGAFYLFR